MALDLGAASQLSESNFASNVVAPEANPNLGMYDTAAGNIDSNRAAVPRISKCFFALSQEIEKNI